MRLANKAASEKSCKEMMRLMGMQQMRTRIPKYMDGDTRTPHKTGDFPPYLTNDVGLIETPAGRVAVVFFSAHHCGYYSELEDAIGRMSEQVWGYFNYRGQGKWAAQRIASGNQAHAAEKMGSPETSHLSLTFRKVTWMLLNPRRRASIA
jgi:hypothetical protein